MGSVHFDPLLLFGSYTRSLFFFGTHFLKILVFSFLEEDENSWK